MLDRVRAVIDKYSMLEKGDRVLVALSGGADSVALLLTLLELKAEYGVDLFALHVNHRLRADESDRDEEFCRRLCERVGVGLNVLTFDVAAIAAATAQSVETAARDVRYEALENEAKRLKCTRIATAHTANDNAETVIMNLARGAALWGLCGIAPVRGPIIRPLIEATRLDVEEYLKARKQDFCTDSTNLGDDYRRNRVRHHIIPRMVEMNPAFFDAVTRMCSLLREDEEAILSLCPAKSAGGDGEIDIEELLSLHRAPARRMVRRAADEAGASVPSALHIERVLSLAASNRPSGRVELPGKMDAKRQYGRIIFKKRGGEIPPPHEKTISGRSGRLIYGGYGVTWQIVSTNRLNVKKNLMTGIFNYDMINDNVMMRPRQKGDAYPPLGFSGRRTVKKMLIDGRVPRGERDLLPVFTMGREILWCAGLRINNGYRVNSDTKNILIIEVEKCEGATAE